MKAQNETDSARICARCNKAEVHKSLFRKSQYYEGNGALCYECQVELISRYWVNAAEEFDQRAPGFLSVARKSYDASDHLTWGPCIVSWHLGLGLDDHFNTESKKTISFEEFLGCYSKTVLEEYFYTYFRSIGAAQWELLGKMFIVYIDQYNNHHAKITVNTIDSLTGLLQKMIAESQDVLSNLEPGFLSNDIWDDVGISMEEVEYEEMLIEEEEEQQEYERTHYSLDTWYQQIKNVTPLKDVFIGEKWEQVDRTMEAIGLASDSWVQAKPSHARTTTVEIEDIIEEFERVRTSLYFAALQYYDDSFMPDEKRLSFEELLNYISAYANKQYEYAQVELSAVNGVLVPWCRIAKEQRDYKYYLCQRGPRELTNIDFHNRAVMEQLSILRNSRNTAKDVYIIYIYWSTNRNEDSTFALLTAIKENLRKHISTCLNLGIKSDEIIRYVNDLPEGGTFADMLALLDHYPDDMDEKETDYTVCFSQIIEPLRLYCDKYRTLIERFGLVRHSKPNEDDNIYHTDFLNTNINTLYQTWVGKNARIDDVETLYERNCGIVERHKHDIDINVYQDAIAITDAYELELSLVAHTCDALNSIALMRESVRILEEVYEYLYKQGHKDLRKLRVRSLRQDIEDLVFDISCIEQIEKEEKDQDIAIYKRRTEKAEEANAMMVMHISRIIEASSIDEIINLRAAFAADMRQLNYSTEKSEGLVGALIARLCDLISEKHGFSVVLERTKELLGAESTVTLDNSTMRTLATAEWLYQQYVVETQDQ